MILFVSVGGKPRIANAREKGKLHGRPATAFKKKDDVLKFKKDGLNNSQIAKKLKISRASVISFLK